MGKRIDELKALGWDANTFAELLKEIKAEVNVIPSDPNDRKQLKKRINHLLIKLGTPLNAMGSDFLKSALFYCVSTHSSRETDIMITKDLYPIIAKKHKVTTTIVEDRLFYVFCCITKKKSAESQKIFGEFIDAKGKKASNGEFISILANYMIQGKDLL